MLPRSSWGTLLLAYKLVLGVGRPVFVRLMKWPFLALLAASAVQLLATSSGEAGPEGEIILSPGAEALALVVQLAATAAVLPGVTAWMRWVVDPSTPTWYRWRREEWVFLGRLLQIYLFSGLTAAATLAAALFLLNAAGSLPAGLDETATAADIGIGGFLAVIAAAAAGLAVVVRYSMSPVAAAVGAPSGLESAVIASRNAHWHQAWTLILYAPTSVAAMLPFLILGMLLVIVFAAVGSSPFMASIWGTLFLALLYIPVGLTLYGVLAAVFCLYYRWLVLKDPSH